MHGSSDLVPLERGYVVDIDFEDRRLFVTRTPSVACPIFRGYVEGLLSPSRVDVEICGLCCMEPATIVRSVFELGFEVDSEVVFSVLLAVVRGGGFSRLLAQALWWRMRFSTLGSRLLGQRVPH